MRWFVLAARFFAPEFCQSPRASHEAIRSERLKLFRQRNATYRLASSNKRRAERRQTHCVVARTQAACGTRHGVKRLAPPSACGRARLPAFHLRSSPTGLSSRGLSVGPGFPKTAPKHGHCRQRRPRSQRCTSRASRSAGRHDARAARERSVSFRPRAPHSLRRRGVPSSDGSFRGARLAAVIAVVSGKSKALKIMPINQCISRETF